MKYSQVEIKKGSNKLSWNNKFNNTCREKILDIFLKYGLKLNGQDVTTCGVCDYDITEKLINY